MHPLDVIFDWWTLGLALLLLVPAILLKSYVPAVLTGAIALQTLMQNVLIYRTVTPPVEWNSSWGATVAMLLDFALAAGYTALAIRLFRTGRFTGLVFGFVALIGMNVSLDMFTSALRAALLYAHQTTVADTPLWLIAHLVFYVGIAVVMACGFVCCLRWIVTPYPGRKAR